MRLAWIPHPLATAAALLLCQGCMGTAASNASPGSVAEGGAARANLNLGAAYFREGQLALALERLDRALEFDPRLAEAHSTIAMVYDRLGDVGEARTHHRRAIRLRPDNPAAANRYGVFLCRQRHWDDAESQFLRAARNPRYATPEVALTNAGMCARTAGDRVKARGFIREALSRNPAYPDGLVNMAALSLEDNELDTAQLYLQRHADVAPDNPRTAWLCVQVETRLGNAGNAQYCASKLREQFADSAEMAQLKHFEHGAR